MITLTLSQSVPSPDWGETDASPGDPWTDAYFRVATQYEPLPYGSPLFSLSTNALSTSSPTINPLLIRGFSSHLLDCGLSDPVVAPAVSSVESSITGLPKAVNQQLGDNNSQECTQVKEPESDSELDALWDSFINYPPHINQAPTDSGAILHCELVPPSSIPYSPAVKPLPKERPLRTGRRNLFVPSNPQSRAHSGKVERLRRRSASRKAKRAKSNTVFIRVAEMTYDSHEYDVGGTFWRSKDGSAHHNTLIEMVTAHGAVIDDDHLNNITALVIRPGGISGYSYTIIRKAGKFCCYDEVDGLERNFEAGFIRRLIQNPETAQEYCCDIWSKSLP